MRIPSSFLPTFRTFLSASLLGLGLISSCLAQTAYTITDLGTLGGAGSVGQGINASGQVTGYSDTATGGQHAFLYSGGSMADLGTLGGASAGQGINASGQVAGYFYTTSGASHAFLYSGGRMTDIGTLGGANSRGLGINNSGQITGYADTGGGFYHAFLYGGGGMTDLGTLPYDSYSEGFGINNSGQVTGWSLSSLHAFLYSGGSMADLGTLGGSTSVGLGINTSGQVVGYSFVAGDSAQHAFLYTPSAGMVDLNTLIPSGSGWTLLAAYGINDAGQITGYGATLDGSTHAFLLSPVVLFSAFAAHLEIGGRPPTSFELGGSFTLGAGSDGINPVIEPVTLQLGSFSITIPRDSFTRTSNGTFNYEGQVGGAALEFRIAPAAGGFTFTAEGSRIASLPASNPVTVALTVGDDTGTTIVVRK